jgi:hypothetical protein
MDVWRDVARVDDASSCWLWMGWRNKNGYGQVKGGLYRNKTAHRVVWTHVNGPIPDGLWVLHRCDNPPCVRPDHLFLGTPSDNAADMVAKGRQARGAMKSTTILTADQVREIRLLRAAGLRQKDIAERFGVCRATIGHILTGRQWTHVV